jgi:hypothetical protein
MVNRLYIVMFLALVGTLFFNKIGSCLSSVFPCIITTYDTWLNLIGK